MHEIVSDERFGVVLKFLKLFLNNCLYACG